jgi:WD40 repeat protein
MTNSIMQLQLPNYEQIVEITFSPNSVTFGALYMDGTVKIYEVDDSKLYNEVFTTQATSKLATSISFASPDLGSVFIVGDDSGRIFLYQKIKPNEFSLIVTMSHHKAPINAVAFAPIGATFAAISSDGQLSVTTCADNCWNSQLIKFSDSPATSISWSPLNCMSFIDKPNEDESFSLSVSSADGFFAIYSRNANKWEPCSAPVQAHRGSVNAVAWRPLAGFTRSEIATCGDDLFVKLWTFENGQWDSVVITQVQENPVSLKWSSHGFLLSVGCGQSSIIVFKETGNGKWTTVE